MKQTVNIIYKFLLLVLFISLNNIIYSQTKLQLLSPNQSGIYFRNDIIETSTRNVMIQGQIYQYNGGGVAIGDLDNDGLEDIVLTGNCLSSRIYKNKGNLKFEDRTLKSGFIANGWCTGVNMADVNNDGLLDIYICKSRYPDSTAAGNQLFINKGNFVFKDETIKYGLSFNKNSIHGTFFDFDLDGDLDFYLMVHPLEDVEKGFAFDIQNIIPKIYGTDILYENLGAERGFKDATYRLGINGENAFGLGVIAADIDGDELIDLYISNDFVQADFFYKNLGNGFFKESLYEKFAHTAFFSMGIDVNDFNNDGLPDIFTADMSSKKLVDLKQQINGFNYNYYNITISNHGAQNLRNNFQLNNGKNKFSEIGDFSGTSSTDWSWSPLFVDIDLDGNKDLIISNGIKRDILNQEFYLYKYDSIRTTFTNDNYWNDSTILHFVAPYRSANLFYKNIKKYQFKSNASEWGISDVFNSNGAAYADLDNDGDIEIVFNNIDTFAVIYKNLTIENNASNYNWIAFDIKDDNSIPYGSKVYLYMDGEVQYQSLCNSRGYQSKSTDIIHFGLAQHKKIDSIKIIYPDQTYSMIDSFLLNTINHISKQKYVSKKLNINTHPDFKTTLIFNYTSADSFQKTKDFITQPLLYKTISDIGPASLLLSNKKDLFVGAYLDEPAKIIHIQDTTISMWTTDKHDIIDYTAIEFDINDDGQNELLISSGRAFSYHDSIRYQINIYKNENNIWLHDKNIKFPTIQSPISKILPLDFDNDGDLDLFLAASYSIAYPNYPSSYLWENRGKGMFLDKSNLLPAYGKIGNIKDAVVSKTDNTNTLEIILVGEWMPIKILKIINNKKILLEEIPNTNGLWQSIFSTSDNQNSEFLVGNIGLNSRFHQYINQSKKSHLSISTQDLNNDGVIDPVVSLVDSNYIQPIYFYNDFIEYFPASRKKAYSYIPYSTSQTKDLLPAFDANADLKVNQFKSGSLVFNNNKYAFIPFEESLQLSSINDICPLDSNKYIFVGNQSGMRRDLGNIDASRGHIVFKNGNTLVHKSNNLLNNSDQINNVFFTDNKIILVNHLGHVSIYQYEYK